MTLINGGQILWGGILQVKSMALLIFLFVNLIFLYFPSKIINKVSSTICNVHEVRSSCIHAENEDSPHLGVGSKISHSQV